MGLGKTLQALTVMWTLLEQDIFAGEQTCTNGIVICPASLVQNWDNEVKHWLGESGNKTMKTYPCTNKTKDVVKKWLNAIRLPTAGVNKPVLIISYESFRSYHETICYKAKPPKSGGKIVDNEKSENMKIDIGFVVCDEGHKLKNYKSQLSVAVSRIKSKRRLLLSGTPIQNNLKEMYSLVNFVNPGVWSNVQEFSKDACKIVRSFDSTAKEKAKGAGTESLSAVRQILNKFLLQRTSKVVMKYLPKKSEYVVFCKLSPLQEKVYETFLNSKKVKATRNAVGDSGGLSADGFLACGILGKICNHPALIYEACAKVENKWSNGHKSKWKLVSAASKAAKVKKGRKKKGKKEVSHRTSSDYDADGNRIKKELMGLYKEYPKDFLSTYAKPEHSSKMAFTISLHLL